MKRKILKFLNKLLISVIILLIGLITLKANPNLRNTFYRKVFQNNLKFAKIDELYKKYFGSSLPLTGNENSLALVSAQKIEYEKEEKYKDGVKLKVSKDYAIPVIKSGIVIFAGEKEGYGKTIIVEDADGVETWYSNIKEIKVDMYDYLKKGSIISQADGETLILSFTKDGKKIDYKKYL